MLLCYTHTVHATQVGTSSAVGMCTLVVSAVGVTAYTCGVTMYTIHLCPSLILPVGLNPKEVL